MYNPNIGRWNGVDALAEERYWMTPYNYVQNNPIIRIDPDGNSDNPIYDYQGNFLGTDDRGLQGEAIVMDKSAFNQGISHVNALANGELMNDLSNDEYYEFVMGGGVDHFENLSTRPDWDGILTIEEGIAWAKAHPNLDDNNNPKDGLGNAKADDKIYLDAAKFDFGDLRVSDFKAIGQEQRIKLLGYTNFFSASSRNTTYALGRTHMTLLNKDGDVSISPGPFNNYDWDYGGTVGRNILIWIARHRNSLDDSHGFPLEIYGTGRVSTKRRIEVPSYIVH
jgi:hypothetical protein